MAYHEGQPEVVDPDRRRLLKAGGTAGAIVAMSSLVHRGAAGASLLPLDATNTGPEDIPRKPLGRTGERVYDKPSRCQIIVVRLAWLRV